MAVLISKGTYKVGRFPHQPARILKVTLEALPGLSHAFSPDGLNHTVQSEGWVFGVASNVGKAGKRPVQGQGRG